MRRIGLVVNPIAGMGGPVGLKGTDDPERARELGAEPVTPDRARRFVEALRERGAEVTWYTAGEPMGEEVLAEAGEHAVGVHAPNRPTTAEDTREAARALVDAGVDLLVFVGGDGTAADVAEAVDREVPVLGVPSGVKMYSAVFAETPERAARAVVDADGVEAREVLDIDEEAYRRDELAVQPRGVIDVPVHGAVQSSKSPSGDDAGQREHLAEAVAEAIRGEPGTTHILGPGTTLAEVKRELGMEPTLLGFDAWRDGEVRARDADEAALLEVPLPARVWLTPLGGSGFVLGRGNQQVTPAVLRRVGVDAVTVAATASKLDGLDEVRVDAGDPDLDEGFPAYLEVRTGRDRTRMVPRADAE
jgi:NAD+ kinase